MIVKFWVKLDCKRSQIVFGELQTLIQVKLVNAEEVARRSNGLVYFDRDFYGDFVVEGTWEGNTKATLACEGSQALRKKVEDKLFELAKDMAIRQKSKEITIDANEIFDAEVEEAIAQEIMKSVKGG